MTKEMNKIDGQNLDRVKLNKVYNILMSEGISDYQKINDALEVISPINVKEIVFNSNVLFSKEKEYNILDLLIIIDGVSSKRLGRNLLQNGRITFDNKKIYRAKDIVSIKDKHILEIKGVKRYILEVDKNFI